jgi:hypothetical protein
MGWLFGLSLALCLGLVEPNNLSRRLKDFQRWFRDGGGRWGAGVEAEVTGGACYKPVSEWHDQVQNLGAYRVVARTRVPRETVRYFWCCAESHLALLAAQHLSSFLFFSRTPIPHATPTPTRF